MFGSNTNSSFSFGATSSNNNSGAGLFGNANNSNNNNNASGINTGLARPNIFGSTQSNGNNATGLFGNQLTQNTNFNKPPGGLFGNSNTNNNQTGGLFGNSSNSNTTQSGGLFSNNTNNSNNTAAPSGSLFGNSGQPGGSNLFGNTAPGGLFSNNNNNNNGNNNNSLGTSNLFSNGNSNQNSSGLFGGSSTNNINNSSNLNSTNMNVGGPSLANDPYGMSKFTRTTVQVGELLPSITDGLRADLKAPSITQLSIKRKRSTTGSLHASPSVNNNTIIKNLANQMRMRNIRSGDFEDVSGIFSPARHSLAERFVPPSTTVGSIKSGKNFKQILASSKLEEIKKLINKKKVGSKSLLEIQDAEALKDSLPKRRKIVNPDGLIEDEAANEKLLADDEVDVTVIETNNKVVGASQDEPQFAKETKEIPNGYWCLPTIDDLTQLSYDHLANVEDFLVGRVGFGQIAFNYSVDLTDFKDSLAEELFGGVIKIKNKTVQVYPSTYSKPEIGMGLNVPATITLENLAPIDAESNKPILNPSRPEVKNHVKKLKNLKGMRFISYDPIIGTWVFQVGHFSIWGLVDSDNEEDLNAWKKTQNEEAMLEQERTKREESLSSNSSIAELTKFQSSADKKKQSYGTRSLIEDTFVYKIQKNNDSQPTAVIPGGWSFAPVTNPDSSFASLVHKKSENRPKTPEIEPEAEDSDEEGHEYEEILEPESPPFDEDELDVDIGSEIVDEKAYEPEIDDIDLAALEISSKFATSSDWLEQLALASDSTSALNYADKKEKSNNQPSKALTINDVDDLLFNDFKSQIKEHEKITTELRLEGKKFAHFSSNGSIIKKTKGFDKKNMTGVTEVSLRQQFQMENIGPTRDVIERLSLSSTIIKRDNGFPHVIPNPNLSFELLLSGFSNTRSNKEKRLWDLCSRLFDNSRITNFDKHSDRPKVLHIKRRELVSSWLKKSTSEEINMLLMKNQMDPLETIFIHILSNDLVKAVEVAIESNNNHLAVLISLLGSNDSHVISSCQNQLNEWKRTSALKFIPKSILKVYLLLSELPLVKNDLSVDLTEGLSWKLSFSLILNFTDKTVNDSIRELEKLPYEFSNDYELNILRLYTYLHDIGSYDLNEILDTFRDTPLNGKIQWFLYEILVRSTRRLSVKDEKLGDRLTLSFADQLEYNGLYLESLFVLSHLSNDEVIKRQFYNLITRQIFEIIPDLSDASVKQELVKKLHVPRFLILELISLRYRYVEDYWNEVEALIDARFWNEACISVVKYIAPSVIIGDNNERISSLDALINKILVRRSNEWSLGVEIYSNYIKLITLNEKGVKDQDLVGVLQFLLDNLSNLKELDQSKNTKVASTLMSKKIGDIILEIANKYIQSDKILLLPMGESELNYFKYKIFDKDDRDVILE